ncbi:hypothetical protein [Kitasatospora sp. MY 5-36]|uniref:hypothetical protein n=1 Tax=Kitasatospora sp. MY 5-36 TaxID=1678027 RepID=UPI000670B69A|nr:hypothetical protein [Kitasatospora sp. MY 5-36]
MESSASRALSGELEKGDGHHAGALTSLHGYGVRWDTASDRYRVRNEITGEWLRRPGGEPAAFVFFGDAYSAWKAFEVHKRPGER